MGRTVIADEKLIEGLCDLSKRGGFIPGLIIGQCAVVGQKDFVVLLPATPAHGGNEAEEPIGDHPSNGHTYEKLHDIDDNTISEHARAVTRMLPGGMWVLGFFVVGPGDLFSDKNALAKIRSTANKIHNCTKGNDLMNGKDPSNQKLVLHFCSLSKKYVCKTIEMENLNSSIRPVDWKFKSHTTSWLQVQSALDFEWLPPFFVNQTATTKKKLLECLTKFKDHLDSFKYNINGKFCEADQLLSSIEKPVKQNGCDKEEDDNHCKYNLIFFEFMEPKDNGLNGSPYKMEENSVLKLNGLVASKVFLHDKSTAEEAVKTVKDDFVRSLASRLEMHWQTVEEPESMDEEAAYLLRSPPRRVLFKPDGLDIEFSEYVFEGETEDDALSSINENLGFIDCQINVLENDSDPGNSTDTNDEASPAALAEDVVPSINKVNKGQDSILMYGITAAFIILLLSLLIHFLYR